MLRPGSTAHGLRLTAARADAPGEAVGGVLKLTFDSIKAPVIEPASDGVEVLPLGLDGAGADKAARPRPKGGARSADAQAETAQGGSSGRDAGGRDDAGTTSERLADALRDLALDVQ